MATVQVLGLWTLRFSSVLAPIPIVEALGLHRGWGYGLLCPAVVAGWATGRWCRRRELARLREDSGRRAVGGADSRTSFWREDKMGEISETIDVARRSSSHPPEQRERAMRNLVDSIKNEGIEADLRIQLVQDLVDLGGHDMAIRLLPVVRSSDVDIEVRLEAAEHMGRFSAEDGARALEAIATDTTVDDQYRLDAASALVDCARRPAGIALMRLVTDNSVSEYVRHGAANMLRRVNRSSAALAFQHLAAAPLVSPRVRIICAEQLADDNAHEAVNVLWRLIKGVESSMDYNVGIDAAESLHGISPDNGIEAYSALAVDANFAWYGRIEAAYRLGRLGVSDGFDLLSDFARADELDNVFGLAALDRLFQLETETGTLEADD
ncbi:HEAT repeat domain-containing protein [Glycomyces halotolerans]